MENRAVKSCSGPDEAVEQSGRGRNHDRQESQREGKELGDLPSAEEEHKAEEHDN